MAFILCKLHGGHIAAFVCGHIHRELLDGKKVSSINLVEMVFEGKSLGNFRVCDACRRQWNELRHLVDDIDRFYAMDSAPHCSFCVSEGTAKSEHV